MNPNTNPNSTPAPNQSEVNSKQAKTNDDQAASTTDQDTTNQEASTTDQDAAEQQTTSIADPNPRITYVGNETATDRNPYDQISPQTSAANNPFEKDPDDSVDITGPYDDAKAQAIEEKL